MFPELPITNYQIRKLKFYTQIALAVLVAVILLGNIITAIVHTKIRVNGSSYVSKNGFPLFISGADYIKFVKDHPENLGIKLNIHRMGQGESYWDVARRYHVSIDTIIASNPYMKNLIPEAGREIVVPSVDGVLFSFTNFIDVIRMKRLLNYGDSVCGHYLPTPFRIFSTDDMRLVFFKGKRPEMLNDSMARLYDLRKDFQEPVKGSFTSMFGDRVDPTYHEAGFHNGIDIMACTGSPVRPIMDGIVIYTGWRGGYGNTVMVQHKDGYSSLYGHLQTIAVKVGDWVTKDSKVGSIGSTGRSTGPHLHFTFMRHGEIINPLLFIW